MRWPESDKEDMQPLLCELYPQLTEEELRLAEQNLQQYVAISLRIFERLEAEEKAKTSPQSTD